MDASLAALERRFERLNDASHERLPFSIAKTVHNLNTVFEGSRYDLGDQQAAVVESEPNGEKSCTETSDRLNERLYDNVHESVSACLVVCRAIRQNAGSRGLRKTPRIRFVTSI